MWIAVVLILSDPRESNPYFSLERAKSFRSMIILNGDRDLYMSIPTRLHEQA